VTAAESSGRRSKRRIRWWWFAIALPVLALGFWFTWIAILEHRFEVGIDAIRAAHEPVDLAEFNHPPLEPGDDAAPLLRRFDRWYDEHGIDDDWLRDPEYELVDDVGREAARRWVVQSDGAFAWLRAAAAKPDWDFGLDWRKGVELEVPSVPIIPEILDTVRLRARYGDGRAKRIAGEVAILFDLARKVERPTLITCLVRWTMHEVALQTLREAAPLDDFDPVAARALLRPRLREAEDPAGLRDAIRGERVVCMSLVRRWIAGEDPWNWLEPAKAGKGLHGRLNGWFWSSFLMRPWACLDGLHAQEMFREGLEITAMKPWEALARSKAFRGRYNLGVESIHTRLYHNLFSKAWVERCRHLAKLRLARAGLAILAWRAEHGTWPATLDKAGRWIDPFTGGDLIYKVEKDHAQVSVRVPKPENWTPELEAAECFEGDYPIFWRLPK